MNDALGLTLAGTVSLGLHAAAGDARDVASTVLDQAQCAEAAGFDGVTISEHHNGFPAYLPQPLLVANWVLAATARIWAGPLPMLLGLRNPRLVAEELAWTAARHPGRLVAGFAPGYARSDFDAVGESFDDRFARFDDALRTLSAIARHPHHELCDDAAVRALVPNAAGLLSAVNSDAAARRAAELGFGMVFPGREDPARLARLTATYRDAGGRGPVVAIISMWSGARREADDALDRVLVGAAAAGMRQGSGFRVERLVAPTASLIDRASEICELAGATAVNVRIMDSSASAAATLDQIKRIGTEVVPSLRRSLATHAALGTSGAPLADPGPSAGTAPFAAPSSNEAQPTHPARKGTA